MPLAIKPLTVAVFAAFALSANAEEKRHFDIPAQPLSTALQTFAQQSGAPMLYAEASASGKRSPGISGNYSTSEAVARLVSGSGLVYTVAADGTVTLKPGALAMSVADTGNERTLPKVTVEADAENPYDDPNWAADPYNPDYSRPNSSTATKTDTPLFETPFSIQTVPRKVLQDQQAVRIEDAVKNISGVQPGFNFGLYHNFIIRGFDLSGTTNRTYRDGFPQNQAKIDISNTERIDVLKGAAGGLYGRIEPGGLVNQVTKKPLAEAYYSLEQQIGSYDFYRTVADIGGPLDDDRSLLYRAVLGYQDSQSFRDQMENRHLTVAPSLSWNVTPDTELYLNVEFKNYNDKVDGGIPSFGNRPANVPKNRYYGIIDQPIGEYKSYLVDSYIRHAFNEDWSVKLRGSWWKSDEYFFDSQAFNVDSANNRTFDIYLASPYFEEKDTFFAELSLNGKFSTWGLKHNVFLSTEYYRVTSEQRFAYIDSDIAPESIKPLDLFNPRYQRFAEFSALPIENYYAPREEWFAVTFQDQVDITKWLHFLFSGRYDHSRAAQINCIRDAANAIDCPANSDSNAEDIADYDAFTPRIGLNAEIQPWLAWFGSYSESFASSAFSRLRSGKLADPETAQQYETGFKGRWLDDKLTATATYFHLTKQNTPVNVPGPGGFVDQIGEARSQGFELDISGQITDEWKIIANYAYTDAIIANDENTFIGNRLPNAPRHQGGIWSQLDFSNGFGIGTGLYFAGQKEGNRENTFQLPGWLRWDIGASYRWKIGKSMVTTQLNVNNLLDKGYFDTSNTQVNVYPAQPRTFMGSIKVEF